MGGGGSQTINQAFNMSAINKSIFESITENKAAAVASGAVVQNLRVVMRNVRGCSSNFNQKVKSSVTATSELMSQNETEIKNSITNEMQAAVQAQIEKATEMGNMQFGDKQNVNQEVNMEIQNIVENTIKTVNENEATSESVVVQGGDLIIDGYDCRESGDINWGQDVHAQVLAKAITTALTNAIASSELMNKLSAAAGASAKSENKGLADLISKIFEGLTGPLKYGIIASVVCCCLLVLVMIVIGLSPAGQKATGNLGAAGASRMKRF
jgi:hypothetical protein